MNEPFAFTTGVPNDALTTRVTVVPPAHSTANEPPCGMMWVCTRLRGGGGGATAALTRALRRCRRRRRIFSKSREAGLVGVEASLRSFIFATRCDGAGGGGGCVRGADGATALVPPPMCERDANPKSSSSGKLAKIMGATESRRGSPGASTVSRQWCALPRTGTSSSSSKSSSSSRPWPSRRVLEADITICHTLPRGTQMASF